jgi:hypothetical protein
MTSPYTVVRPGFAVDVPAGWVIDDTTGLPLVAGAPAVEGVGFRPNLTVTVGDLPPRMAFDAWQRGCDILLARTLDGYRLLDLERVPVAGAAGVRRLAHHVVDRTTSVTMSQWAVATNSVGITLTVSVATPDFPALRATVEEIAHTLRASAPEPATAVGPPGAADTTSRLARRLGPTAEVR